MTVQLAIKFHPISVGDKKDTEGNKQEKGTPIKSRLIKIKRTPIRKKGQQFFLVEKFMGVLFFYLLDNIERTRLFRGGLDVCRNKEDINLNSAVDHP